jgi:hypothetical protein
MMPRDETIIMAAFGAALVLMIGALLWVLW